MAVAVFDAMFRTGALVFGGGHVVLPLLQAEVVPPGWVTEEQFVAGYGAAQAVPGPLFSFAAYLGAVLAPPNSGPLGPLLWGLLALVAIFLPSFLLLAGALPFWGALRRWTHFQGALRGINAAVVGLLLAALYDPVWTSAIEGPRDVAFALAAFALLALWLVPPWVVVALAPPSGRRRYPCRTVNRSSSARSLRPLPRLAGRPSPSPGASPPRRCSPGRAFAACASRRWSATPPASCSTGSPPATRPLRRLLAGLYACEQTARSSSPTGRCS